MILRRALKTATGTLHDELDAMMSAFDLSCDEGYRAFLRVQARVLPPYEESLSAGGIATLVTDWEKNRRSFLLERDLTAMGDTMPAPVDVGTVSGTPELLGTAYVIEGSRLGGRFLVRSVGGKMPNDFLSASAQKSAWPALLAALDRADFDAAERARAEDASRRCFETFIAVAREELIVD
jgi:heme oxygenase